MHTIMGMVKLTHYHNIQSSNPSPNHKISTSRLKDFAKHNFKFDLNGGKFLKREENTGGKEEITCYKQFLLSPLCF